MSSIQVMFALQLLLAVNVSAFASQPTSTEQAPAGVADLEAAVQAKYTLKEATPQAQAEIPDEVAKLEAAVQAKYLSEGSNRKPQKVAMHDLPHYRKHGAAMVHVESASNRSNSSASNMSSEKAARLAAKRSEIEAKIAARRAEVEDFFHISKPSAPQDSQTPTEAQEPVGGGRKCLLFIFSLAAVCSLAGLAYHKYEVILTILEGKHSSPQFKAKQEDIYNVEGEFAPPPRYAQHNDQGWSATGLATQCSNLRPIRRAAADSINSCGSGV